MVARECPHDAEHTLFSWRWTQVLDLLPQVTDTRRQCLDWARPGQVTRASCHVADKPGDELETDLPSFKKNIIVHVVCRCTRYHAARRIESKTAKDMLGGLHQCWFQHFGFPSVLYFDAEGSINVPGVSEALAAEGTRLHLRAPGQHCRHIER